MAKNVLVNELTRVSMLRSLSNSSVRIIRYGTQGERESLHNNVYSFVVVDAQNLNLLYVLTMQKPLMLQLCAHLLCHITELH
jgi:hypothetical protein